MIEYISFLELTPNQQNEFIKSVSLNTQLYNEWKNTFVYYENAEFYSTLQYIFEEYIEELEDKYDVSISYNGIEFTNSGSIKYNSLRECIFIDFYPNETQYAIENKIYDEIKSNIPKIQNKYQSELHYYYESPRYLTDLVIDYPEFASPIVENAELIGIHSEYTNRDYKI